ncbi:hypothetical protein N7474_009471 [Penicillium riverlandense]|uniref:uncharacterized protein n=1 Tax=Penicillium riverlandense TaxID=1903569 RepID=UPI002548B7A6|nr:uncharacterized protein N7474_009471 [Penicillium riverlandense]KAJ5808202.1 hypothetical protein N7474_009471 [Penicillium riverlandense]
MPSPNPSSPPHPSPQTTADPDRRHHRSHNRHRHHRDSSRSRSPHRSHRHHRDRHRHRHDRDRERDRDRHGRRDKEPAKPTEPVILPLQARELSRRDLQVYEPMFAMYLDIQKGIFLEDLTEEEVKGRWKSFVGKWNRGELAEGWYDPATLDKARKSAAEQPMPGPSRGRAASSDYTKGGTEAPERPAGEDDEDEDYGPALPHSGLEGRYGRGAPHSGPTIPNMQDLELKRVAESAMEDAIAARDESRQQLRAEIRSHRSAVRNLEDEVAPRAEPGTRERQLEKRRELAAANKSFAEARGGSPEGARDEELMGAGDNDLASLRKEKENEKRKKNEREIRREEILRARAAEREERVQKYREKEQETMSWLQTLAKQRFG